MEEVGKMKIRVSRDFAKFEEQFCVQIEELSIPDHDTESLDYIIAFLMFKQARVSKDGFEGHIERLIEISTRFKEENGSID